MPWVYEVVQGLGYAGEFTADALAKKLNDYRARQGLEYVGSVTPSIKDEPYLIFKKPIETK